MSSLHLEIVKILHQKRTYLGWLALLAVPVITVLATALTKPQPPDPAEPPFVGFVRENGLLVALASLIALANFLLPLIKPMVFISMNFNCRSSVHCLFDLISFFSYL